MNPEKEIKVTNKHLMWCGGDVAYADQSARPRRHDTCERRVLFGKSLSVSQVKTDRFKLLVSRTEPLIMKTPPYLSLIKQREPPVSLKFCQDWLLHIRPRTTSTRTLIARTTQ